MYDNEVFNEARELFDQLTEKLSEELHVTGAVIDHKPTEENPKGYPFLYVIATGEEIEESAGLFTVAMQKLGLGDRVSAAALQHALENEGENVRIEYS